MGDGVVKVFGMVKFIAIPLANRRQLGDKPVYLP